MDNITSGARFAAGHRRLVKFRQISTGSSLPDRFLYARGIARRWSLQKRDFPRPTKLLAVDSWRGWPTGNAGKLLIYYIKVYMRRDIKRCAASGGAFLATSWRLPFINIHANVHPFIRREAKKKSFLLTHLRTCAETQESSSAQKTLCRYGSSFVGIRAVIFIWPLRLLNNKQKGCCGFNLINKEAF